MSRRSPACSRSITSRFFGTRGDGSAHVRRRHSGRDVKIAWEKYDRLPQGQPLPWLYATARNLTRNLIRGDRRRAEIIESLGVEMAREDTESDHAAAVAARHTALAALSDLSETDRELVLLVCWEGLDVRQAAMVAGCSRPAAAMRLHRARRRLRRSLESEPVPAADCSPYEERLV